MEKLNGNNDLKTYLQSGVLTQPFLDAEYVKGRIDYDMSQKQSKGREISQLASLMGWIRSRVQYARGEKEFIEKISFNALQKKFGRVVKRLVAPIMHFCLLFLLGNWAFLPHIYIQRRLNG